MGQIVALDLVVLRSLGDFRHPSEVGGDDALQKPVVMQTAGAEAFAVAGARTHDERQVTRATCFDVALLECRMQSFGDAALDEAGRRDDIAFVDERNGFIGRNDLVLEHAFAFPRVAPHSTSARPSKDLQNPGGCSFFGVRHHVADLPAISAIA